MKLLINVMLVMIAISCAVQLVCALDQSIQINKDSTVTNFGSDSCECQGHTCICCVDADLKPIGLNGTACLNATYIPDILGFVLTLTADGKVIYQTTNSLEDPDVCFAFHKVFKVCLDFTNMDYNSTDVSGCATFTASLVGRELIKFPFGCFNIHI